MKTKLRKFGAGLMALALTFAGAGAVQAAAATVTVNGAPCETLKAAFEAAKNVAGEVTIAISAGTINTGNMDGFGNIANKKVTIKGAGMDATELLWTWPSGAGIGCAGAEVTFEDLALTINHQGYGMPYTQGLEHPKSQLYKNVKINGSITTMDDVTFEGCLFTGMLKDDGGNVVDEAAGKYSIWVYGGGINFIDCTFKKTKNASIKLYGEKSNGIACCISGTTFESAGSKGSAIYASNENNIDKPIYEIYIDAKTKVEDGTELILPSGKGLSVINAVKDENGKILSGTFITGNTSADVIKQAVAQTVAEGVEIPDLVNGKIVVGAKAPAVEVVVPAVDEQKGITQEIVEEIVANTEAAAVENTGLKEAIKEEAAEETKDAYIKIELKSVATVETKTTLTFDVKPVVIDGETEKEVSDKLNGNPVAFRLPLTTQFATDYVRANHAGEDLGFKLVKGTGANRYVDLALTHFSDVSLTVVNEAEMVPEGATLVTAGKNGFYVLGDNYYIVGKEGLKNFRDWVNAEEGRVFQATISGKLETVRLVCEGKTFHLVADVDLENEDWTPIADKESWRYFAGVFDGNGKSVINMHIPTTMYASEYIAFMSALGDPSGAASAAELKNLTVYGDVTGKNAAGVVARVDGGLVSNVVGHVTVTGDATGAKIGGISVLAQLGARYVDVRNYGVLSSPMASGAEKPTAGIAAYVNYLASFVRCANYGEISSKSTAGGLVGLLTACPAEHVYEWEVPFVSCTNAAKILVADWHAGGLIGKAKAVSVENKFRSKVRFSDCANLAQVVSEQKQSGSYFGAFVGAQQQNEDEIVIEDCATALAGQRFSGENVSVGLSVRATITNGDIVRFYPSISGAIAVTKAGDVVVLEANSSESFELPLGVTFKQNGKTYTGTISAPEGYFASYDSVKDEWTCQPIAAKIGDKSFSTLAEALSAVNDGETLTMFADAADIGTVSLKGIVFDGNGHKITGASAFYCGADKATTVKNVIFENIHNPDSTQSAIYGEGFKTGSITITGCTFDNIDWDAIQIVPAGSGVTGSVTVTGNVFRHTGSLPQLRYIHIQYTEYGSPKIVVVATDNQMYDCEKGVDAFCVAGYLKGEGSVYSGNYISDVTMIECSQAYDIKIVDFYPMRTQPTVDVDDLDPKAVFDLKPIMTGDELAAAINACTKAKPDLYFRGDLTATSPVVFENPNITKIWWYGVATSGTAGFTFRAPSLKTGVPLYLLNDAKIVLDGAFVANGKCEIISGVYSAESFSGSFEISGGKFNKDISALVEPRIGHAVDNGDGTWSVEAYTDQTALEDGKPFKVTGPHYYASMEEAIKESRIFDVIGDASDDVDFGSVSPQITLKNLAAFAGSLKSQALIKLLNDSYTTAKVLDFTSVTCPTFQYGGGNKWFRDVMIGGGEIGRLSIDSTYTVTTLAGDLKVDEIVIGTYYYTSKHQKAALTITGGTYGKIMFRQNVSLEPVDSLPNDAVDLKITGGTFGFDPTPYVPTENYRVIQNGETWTVAEKQTEVVVDKAKVEDESGAPIEGEAAAQAEAIKTDVSSTMMSSAVVDFTGTGIKSAATSEDGTMAPALVDAFGKSGDEKDALAASQSNFEWLSNSLDKVVCKTEGGNASLQRLEYTVKPYAKVIYTVGTEEKTEETVIPNSVFAGNPITFRLAVIWDVGDQVKVFRDGSNFGITYVKADEKDGSKHFVEVKSDHFSVFTLEKTSAPTPTVCEVNGQAFESVDAAITASAESPTAVIKLTAPCGEENLPLKWGQEIDLNGQEFTGSITPVAEPDSGFDADQYEQVKTPEGRVFSAPKQVAVPLDDSAEPAKIKVRIAGKTADELKVVQTSGRALWQDLAMGSAEKLIPQVLRSAIGIKTITIRGTISDEAVEAAAKVRDGVSVKYQLMKKVGSGAYAQFGEVQDKPVFTVEADELEVQTFWKIQTIFDEEY